MAGMQMDAVLDLALNVSRLTTEHGLDFVMWYTTDTNPTPVIIDRSQGGESAATVMRDGLRLTLKISERGRQSYFALYPRHVVDSRPRR